MSSERSAKRKYELKQRAEDMTPPGKEIWFILVRNGTWFPAAEVYWTPEKINGRVCSGRPSLDKRGLGLVSR